MNSETTLPQMANVDWPILLSQHDLHLSNMRLEMKA